MAISELNERSVLGRKIKPICYYAHGEDAGQRWSTDKVRRFVNNYDIVAVVGHASSKTAIRASVAYEYNGVVFIFPGPCSPNLTSHGFKYVFRNIPPAVVTGRRLADAGLAMGFTRMLIVDDSSEYGKALAEAFRERATSLGVEVIRGRSYFPWQTSLDFRLLIDNIKGFKFDAIFLGGSAPLAAYFIKEARTMGVTAPFIGGDGLDSNLLWEIAGEAAEGTIVSTVFNSTLSDPLLQTFNKNFYIRFKEYPDTWAAQGYDALMVLAFAFEKSQSTVPLVVSSTLRFIENWHGVAGSYSFTQDGNIVGRPISFKVLRRGRFEYLNQLMDLKPQ
jgi:branched-chain amino acid transport system substrate-binding protein